MASHDSARERMQVIARIRPMLTREVESKEECAIAIRDNELAVASSTQLSPVVYRLDKVLGVDRDQASVFSCIKHNLDQALDGFNTTVFAYGYTGTGKTHTMLGVDMWQLAQDEHARIAAAPRTPAAPRRDPRTPRTGASSSSSALGGGVASALGADRLMSQMDGGDMLADLMQYEGDFHPSWGLIPRAMAYLFRRLTVGGRYSRGSSPRPGHHPGAPTMGRGALPAGVVITCSYLEVYAERVFDLLRPETVENRAQVKGQGASTGLDVVHDKTRGVLVPEAVAVQVQSEEDVLSLLWEGAKNRLLSSTDMNQHSSRSHTIWQVTIRRSVQRRTTPGKGTGTGKGKGTTTRAGRGRVGSAASGAGSVAGDSVSGSKEEEDGDEDEGVESVVVQSKINLVDLAGSEKIRTHDLEAMTDRRLAELTSINASLSCLSNCIRALADSSRTHIPYRDSKLTRLLQDSLGGNCKTTFVVTLSPASSAIDETVSTLQFAERAKRVEMHASRNETLDDASLLRKYEHQVQRLKKLLKEARSRAGTGIGPASAAAGGPSSMSRIAPGGAALMTADQLAQQARDEIAELRSQLRGAHEERRQQQQEVLRLREQLHVEQGARRSMVLASVQRAGDAVQAVVEASGSSFGSVPGAGAFGGRGSPPGSAGRASDGTSTGSGAEGGVVNPHTLRAAAAKAAEALRAVEGDREALRKRAEVLAADEEDTQTKRYALRKYYEWLRSVPTVPALRAGRGKGRSSGGGRRGSFGGSNGSSASSLSPSAVRWAERVSVLQGTVDELEQGALLAKDAMQRDLARLQKRLEEGAADHDRLTDGLKGAQEEMEAMSTELRSAASRADRAEAALVQEKEARAKAENAATVAHARATDDGDGNSGDSNPAGAGAGAGSMADDPAKAADVLLAARTQAQEQWTHHVDRRTQRSYWHSKESGATQWERPAGLDSAVERALRHEHAAVVERFRGQLGRLFGAVTGELKKYLEGILRKHAQQLGRDGGQGAQAAAELLAAAAGDETDKYCKETQAALDREVSLLAASMALRYLTSDY